MLSKEGLMIRGYLEKSGMWNRSLDEIRSSLEIMDVAACLPDGISSEQVDINGVGCELFIPKGADREKVILYFHGGGYCIGIVNTNRNFIAKLAKESGYCTLLFDYRLAPENPYPAAHEDALNVYKWLQSKGYNSKNIVFMGDSSGCGLILATLFKLREFGIDLPSSNVLMTPVLDYTKTAESLITRRDLDPFQYLDPFGIANNFLLNNSANDPSISPLYGSLEGLPPILIQAADHDVFLSDSLNIKLRAEEIGWDIKLTIWEELWHIFQMSADYLPEGQKALNEIYEFVNKFLK